MVKLRAARWTEYSEPEASSTTGSDAERSYSQKIDGTQPKKAPC